MVDGVQYMFSLAKVGGIVSLKYRLAHSRDEHGVLAGPQRGLIVLFSKVYI